MKKKIQKGTVNEKIAAREKELSRAFAEMVKTIDDYMNAAPVLFIEGGEAAPGQYLFPDMHSRSALGKYHSWIERWMGALYPRTLRHQKTINAGKGGDDEYMELCYDGQRFGFLLGYLVGCRSMGADKQELLAKAGGFTLDTIGHERWVAEQDAKK